jgi:hypothetical protein
MSEDGGNIHTDMPDDKGAGVVWAVTIVMLIAVIAGLYFYLQSENEAAAGHDDVIGTIQNGPATAEKAGNAADKSSAD